ncbi:tetratricopeptide repeat protein [Luteococcus peritonei]|uniref:Tetratricopeptide repeat protein n=1 Tax=Luteococcus peritonei TaxID=88874 RepID=A0ABW4RZQ3_9ACTN
MSTTNPSGSQGNELERLEAFLAGAPEELKPWAEQQLARARKAAAAQGAATEADPEAEAVAEDFDLLGLDDDEAVTPTGSTKARPVAVRTQRKGLKPLMLAGLSALVVFGGYTIYAQGKNPDATTPNAANPASAASVQVSTPKPVDPQMVASLEKKVKDNPKDTLSMKALGEIYSQAAQYDKAATWQERITTVDPKDVDAFLALGVAQFNQANLDEAEKAWTQATKLAPKRATIWYNLGFLYLSKNQISKAQDAWQKVVEIDPDSDLAKTVSSHLKAMASAKPSASGTPAASAVPSPSASQSR